MQVFQYKASKNKWQTKNKTPKKHPVCRTSPYKYVQPEKNE